jgi:hypothetical protein
MKYICPVCGSTLMYERRDNAKILVEIVDGIPIERMNKPNGETAVYCTNDCTHDITDELQDAAMIFVEVTGY